MLDFKANIEMDLDKSPLPRPADKDALDRTIYEAAAELRAADKLPQDYSVVVNDKITSKANLYKDTGIINIDSFAVPDMSMEQAKALISHELGHIEDKDYSGEGALNGAIACASWAVGAAAIATLVMSSTKKMTQVKRKKAPKIGTGLVAGSLAAGSAALCAVFLANSYEIQQRHFDNEFHADRIAAKNVGSAQPMIELLQAWKQDSRRPQKRMFFMPNAVRFAPRADNAQPDCSLLNWLRVGPFYCVNTHPTEEARIERLRQLQSARDEAALELPLRGTLDVMSPEMKKAPALR